MSTSVLESDSSFVVICIIVSDSQIVVVNYFLVSDSTSFPNQVLYCQIVTFWVVTFLETDMYILGRNILSSDR